MEKIAKEVQSVRLRINLRHFFGKLGWCLFATLSVAVGGIAFKKFYPIDIPEMVWASIWIGGALTLGLIIAVVWASRSFRGQLDAAIEIDREFGLRERISSAVSLDDRERDTQAGRAVVADATKRVGRIDAAEPFGLKLHWRAVLPLVPALAIVLAMTLGDRSINKSVDAAIAKQVESSVKLLPEEIERRRKEAKKKGFTETSKVLKEAKEQLEVLAKKQMNRKQAMIKLNDVSKELQKRRQSLAGSEKIRQQLRAGLKKVDKGPLDKFSSALKKGNLRKAAEQLNQLIEKIENEQLDPEAKEKLKDRLAQLQQKLQKMADAQEQAKKDLEQLIQQAGNGAQGFKDQLNEMKFQDPQMDMLRDMANQLGNAVEGLNEGNSKKVTDAMNQMSETLQQLSRQLDELDLLDDAMDQFAEAKGRMNCRECAGTGCAACQGSGQGDQPGFGLGAGRGQGARPEADSDVGFIDDRVRQHVGKGKVVITGIAGGPNVRGKARDAIQTEYQEGKETSPDSLTGQRLPRSVREHVQEYFDSLRKQEQ